LIITRFSATIAAALILPRIVCENFLTAICGLIRLSSHERSVVAFRVWCVTGVWIIDLRQIRARSRRAYAGRGVAKPLGGCTIMRDWRRRGIYVSNHGDDRRYLGSPRYRRFSTPMVTSAEYLC
jgi:hypothetical protein